MARRRIYLTLLVLWVAFTFMLTSLPNPQVDISLPYLDKIAHFVFYGVMGFLCALWQRESGRRTGAAILAGIVFASIVGAVDEIHQHWIPGRSMDVLDWVSDTAGGGAGALASAFLPLFLPFLLTE
ncbi:MAG: VanZ family protein [Deltaproteobacteria bacterium]|nr:VanZ family protein [Deltaproteobacteria bacterium]